MKDWMSGRAAPGGSTWRPWRGAGRATLGAALVACGLLSMGSLAACLDDGDADDDFDDFGDEGLDPDFGEDLLALFDALPLRDCGRGDLELSAARGEPFIETVEVEMTRRAGDLVGADEPIYVALPEDLDGISIIAEAGSAEVLLLPIIDERIVFVPSAEADKARTLNFPFNRGSDLAGECLALYPALVDGDPGDAVRVHVIARVGTVAAPIFPVNLVVVGDTDVSDAQLQEMTEVANAIYEDNGAPSIVIQGVIDEGGPSIVDDEGDALDALRGGDYGEDPFALNVIFVQGFLDEGVLGFAGGVPGPAGVPTAASAVVLAIDGHLDGDGDLDINLLGSTLAHELGHQLGLFHTTEERGDQFDPIGDTDQCDPSNDLDGSGDVSAEECEDFDGGNLMFYIAGEEAQTELSDEQVQILNAHPLAF